MIRDELRRIRERNEEEECRTRIRDSESPADVLARERIRQIQEEAQLLMDQRAERKRQHVAPVHPRSVGDLYGASDMLDRLPYP